METGIEISKLLDRVRAHPPRLAGFFRALSRLPADFLLPDPVVEQWCVWLYPGQPFVQQLKSSLLAGPPALRGNVISLLTTQSAMSSELSRLLFRVAYLDLVPAVRQRALETLAEATWSAAYPLIGGDTICHQALLAREEPLRAAGIRLAMRYQLRGMQADLKRIAEADPSPNLRQLADRGLSLLHPDGLVL